MNIIKHLLLGYALLALACMANAQSPDWKVNPSDFQYTCTITAFLSINGKSLENEQNMVGAFIDGQVRGVASLIHVKDIDRYLAFLTVYANTDGETISFKIFENASNRILDIEKTIDFQIDQQFGNTFQAVSLANPPLRTEAEIKNFFFSDYETATRDLEGDEIFIQLHDSVDLDFLVPEFVISDGATIYIDRIKQESGASTISFSSPVTYSVLSEDQSVLNMITVTVSTDEDIHGSPNSFYSTNIITANNDGQNDYWIVRDNYKYNEYRFTIYDINGRVLYESYGYQNDWDGTFNGRRLDQGKYYYVVKNETSSELIKGSILVLY